MADEPLEELGGKTPLEAAETPHMDRLAAAGEIGLVETVPEGFHPGSDVANLTVFGYDPAVCYRGRAPLEAASMGVNLGPQDVAFRLNLVHLSPRGGDLYMGDYSAGHITTAEARELIDALQGEYGGEEFRFFPGVSYRHLMVWRNGSDALKFTPPHDISGQSILTHLPHGEGADRLIRLMNDSQLLFNNHPLNKKREAAGKVAANSIWLWGHGRAPQMDSLEEKFGITGAVISAVDLVKGIGVCAGLDVIEVEGATGYTDTNYQGKVDAALGALATRDLVYLHVEAPDEAGHSGNLEEKIRAIEDFDGKIVGPVLSGLKQAGAYRVLLLPDHPTPVKKMTHTLDPVPYVLFDSGGGFTRNNENRGYGETNARASKRYIQPGHRIMKLLINGGV